MNKNGWLPLGKGRNKMKGVGVEAESAWFSTVLTLESCKSFTKIKH